MKTEKHCRGCEITKPAEDYYKIGGKYLSAMCKTCDIKKSVAYGRANPERRKSYRKKNKEVHAGTAAHRARIIHQDMVQRSRRKGWGYPEFTVADVLLAIEGGSCAQTGLPFDFAAGTSKSRNPWTPVPDRIDSTLPYTKSNVQWVCNMYNAAKQSWTDEEVRVMIYAAVANQRPGDF